MNYADRMEQESRLMGRLARWMEEHGEVVDVDGMTCRIGRLD